MFKRILRCLFALVLICIAFPGAAADETPMCSIQVTLPGGNLTLYRIGSIMPEGTLLPEDTFAEYQIDETQLQSPELAAALADFAQTQDSAGSTQTLSSPGTLVFDGLQPGLYLLMQTEAAEGFEIISPFLVVLPGQENGKPVYQIDATPKISLTPAPTEPDTPDPSLPQTGQLKWPVPLLVISGAALLAIGLYLQKRRPHG